MTQAESHCKEGAEVTEACMRANVGFTQADRRANHAHNKARIFLQKNMLRTILT